MLTNLQPQPADKILALSAAFKADTRPEKVDLGVGVYRNAEGITPIMGAVKEAERLLLDQETSKSYTSLAGDPAFSEVMANLILGEHDAGRRSSVATPGGTGAVRQGFELIRMASPGARVFLSAPTWPNHPSILKYLGIPIQEYRYFNAETGGVDFDAMMEDLSGAKPGDAILLHGCCHNPTGANLNLVEWQALTDLILKTGATPFIDIAYQGFGDGLEEDAAGLRLMASQVPELLIAASCSKNFGIYRERTGCLIALSEKADGQPLTQGTLAYLNRQNFSFPPDHGARLVTMILQDEGLRAAWASELESMRLGMLEIREALANALREETGSDRFGFIAAHRGMFSRFGLSAEQVEKVRADSAVYMVGDSRVNIAGLTLATVPTLAKAVAQVL